MRQTYAIDIDAPPATVFGIMTDVAAWPAWTASVSSVRMLTSGPLARGSQARVRQPRLGELLWTVTEVQPGRSFRWESDRPGVHTVADHEIAPLASGGSRVTLSVDMGGPLSPLLRPFASLTRHYLELEATGLKRAAEARLAA